MAASLPLACASHSLGELVELRRLRSGLLDWYDSHKRDLPWRARAAAGSESDPNVRAYAVWVSEVMLQQTQVATVIDYYNQWMQKWPAVDDLANATLEEVREMWAGLGYYSRGQRLWEGAKKVIGELGGNIPSSSEALMRELPGVGRYTASAIASIAFGERCGVVDGNVVRVLARLSAMGAEAGSQPATAHLWSLANTAVDPGRPGDFNQAVMELGATICTPRTPLCPTCPLRDHCQARRKTLADQQKHSLDRYSEGRPPEPLGNEEAIEGCTLCLPPEHPWNPSLGVLNYPRKAKKQAPKSEHFAVAIVECEGKSPQLLLRRRPDTGLLAGLWEFPCTEVQPSWSESRMWLELQMYLKLPTDVGCKNLGTVSHQFSHRLHHYHTWLVAMDNHLEPHPSLGPVRWVSHQELPGTAIPAAVKKMYRLLGGRGRGDHGGRGRGDHGGKGKGDHGGGTRKRKLAAGTETKQSKRQKTMDVFLKSPDKTITESSK